MLLVQVSSKQLRALGHFGTKNLYMKIGSIQISFWSLLIFLVWFFLSQNAPIPGTKIRHYFFVITFDQNMLIFLVSNIYNANIPASCMKILHENLILFKSFVNFVNFSRVTLGKNILISRSCTLFFDLR